MSGNIEATISSALPEFLTMEELAALLRVNKKTVYAAVKKDEIPGVRKVGGVLRASRDAVLAWFPGQVGGSRPAQKGQERR